MCISGCYGLTSDITEFVCSRCSNVKYPEASMYYNCILCPNIGLRRETALKKTIGRNWAHVSCCIWTPEIKFNNASMDYVENISLIDKKRWKTQCKLCNSPGGSCIFVSVTNESSNHSTKPY